MADINTGQSDLGRVKTAIHRRLIQKLNLDRLMGDESRRRAG